MQTDKERILTTHTGSLIRPAELVAKLENGSEATLSKDPSYTECLRKSVAEVVRDQVDAGLDIVDDGEFGKSSWSSYILERIEGFELHRTKERTISHLGIEEDAFPGFYSENRRLTTRQETEEWVCSGPIHYGKDAVGRDIENLKAALEGVEGRQAFMPVVAPASFARDSRNEYYRSEEEYVFAIADALKDEYRAIVDAGLLLQVDDAVLATMYLMIGPSDVETYRRWAELRIEALNYALEDLPQDRIRYHLCWGSWNGPHTFDRPLKEIADLLLRVRAGFYLVEAANPRHAHEWRIWDEVTLPEDRVLVPGLVSHSTNVVEHPEWIAERIVQFAEVVGRERVIAGADCGFAQAHFLQRVHPEIQWAKLRALGEGAELASRRLWVGDR